ncbi:MULTISPECIES: hypothetical protein [unclassified Lentimonas]|uniref:hypothetical protein n=1 Tax=unclassified Lentimonas TaxID=2630993 RepID=UPI001329B4FF|nr:MULTISPECIES: hypothetical protein [unclassified Lentimonas]CAA6689850.1 Unannotated [Lentimonas sp. CC10]CAA6697200.1 Unannotated [Lentimonas sp. CC19]CAA7069452.1 Unannotated [Lentimonas sp. CC11]
MIQDTSDRYSAEEWEHLRQRFLNSILIDTEIAILGQNASITWPFKGSDETPSKYIEYDFEELQSVPGLVGKMSRIKKLMDILRETLAFDDPFSDMADTVEVGSEIDDAFERILEKLEIPENYPAEFIHFSPETKELLKAEGIETLIQAIHYGQDMSPSMLLGGDLKSFLNGLALVDEPSIVKHLPYRRTERNLHLAEAVGLIARDLDQPIQLELLSQAGVSLTDDEEMLRKRAGQDIVDTALKQAMVHFDALCAWFTKEAADLEQVCKTSGEVERYFIAINEPRRERVAAVLARAKFGIPASERRGFLGKISGMFGG